MKRIAVVLLLGFSLSLHAAEIVRQIPKQFRGRWVVMPAACAVDSDSEITFGTSDVRFYEGRGRVLAMAAHGRTQFGMLIEGRSEGETRLVVMNLELSPDEKFLYLREGPYLGPPRIRCDR